MASVANAVAGMAGSAAGGAINPLISIIGEVAKPLLDLIPDPKLKAEQAQHVADQQVQIALAQIDQQNQIIKATSANVAADPHSSGSRAYFCYGITTMILANYGLIPIVNMLFKSAVTPFAIPANILWIFATIMLGFVGVPSVMETLKSVMGMPGDSQLSVLGVKIGNKS